MINTEGIQHFFELMTQQQSVPAEYYMGWAENVITAVNASFTVSDLTELSGNGYARQRVAPGQAAAEGTLTLDEQVSDGDTMTIDAVTYRFKYTMAQAEDIQIGGTPQDTQQHIIKTINGTGAAGVDYFAGSTSPHTTVSMNAWASDEAVLVAATVGTAGNSIVTTDTFTIDSGGNNGFDGTTLGTTRLGGWELVSAAGGVNGRTLTTVEVTFEASGGNWNAAMSKFLTTTLSGSGGPLIAIEELNEGVGVSLLDGQSYDCSMVLLGEPG